jgi:hypothetical protein
LRVDESAAFIDILVGLSENYASYTASRIWVVTHATRDHVNVIMHYRLASYHTAVESNVEAQDGRVFLEPFR